jgi:PKD repeat protein
MANVYKQYRDFRISPGNIALGQLGRDNMTVSSGTVSVDFSGTDPWLEYCLDTLGFTSFRFPLTGYSPRRADRASNHPDSIYFWGAPPYDMNPTYADHMGQYIKLVADHYRQKGWLDRSYVYVTDEPIAFNDDVTSYWQHPDYHVVQQFCNLTRSQAADLKFVNTVQLVSELFNHTDTWAVPAGSYHELDSQDRMAQNQPVWWYNVDAGIASQGTEGRALYWDTFSRGVGGVLYWGTNYWDYDTVNGDPWQGSNSDGDGFLFYPGKNVGILDDVVPSLRLFLARDGIEDYELLHRYGEIYGIEAARAVAESVAVGSAFAGARFCPINDSRIYEVRSYLAEKITRQPDMLTWDETFRNAGNVSSASGLQPDFAWEGAYSLAHSNPPVTVDTLDATGAWRPNNQPHIFSSVSIDTSVKTEGTGSLRIDFWRDDDPGELGGYDNMRNGRVVTDSVPIADWSGYDLLEMDVRSVEHPSGNLYMLIGDASGTVVSSNLHRYTRYCGGPDMNWTHVVIDISGKNRSAIQFIEPIVYNYFLEVPYHHYSYWLDNITVRKSGYRTSGSIVSKPIDLGIPTGSIEMDHISGWVMPSGTAISFATRSSADNQNWSDWASAVPDGRFSIRVASPPARHFQFRANLTSDGKQTPVLSEMMIFYRPLTECDLSVGNITFDPAVPNENEPFNISVLTNNSGGPDIIGAGLELLVVNATANLSLGKAYLNISSGQGSSANFSCKAANGTYTVTAGLLLPQGVSDPDLSDNAACATLFVNAYPRPAMDAPRQVFVGQQVVFNASATADDEGGMQFLWAFHDGNLTGPVVNRTFNCSGVMNFTLTVDDIRGARSSINSSIEILNRTPVPNFIFTPENGTVLTAFIFISTAYDPDGQIANHSWSFGDGAQAFGPVVRHSFAQHRQYQINYTVGYFGNATMRSSSASRQLTVQNLPPVANFTMSPDPAGKRKIVQFDGSASGDADDELSEASFAWSFGDGASASGRLAAHAYVSAGIFNVSLTVTDGQGAGDTRTARLRILNLLPVPDFSMPANVTVNQSFYLDASASRDPDGTIAAYRWEFDDGTSISQKSAVHYFAFAGMHKVQLTVTDDDGGSASAEKYMRVDPAGISPHPPPSGPRQGIDVSLILGVGAMLAFLGIILAVLAQRRRKPTGGTAAPSPGAPPPEPHGSPRIVGPARAPPPRVVGSVPPPAPPMFSTVTSMERKVAEPVKPPATPAISPPAGPEIPTISLEEAAGNVIELPRPSGFVHKTAEGHPPVIREAADAKPIPPSKPEKPPEPESDPTLPYNPWGAEKR